MQFANGGSYLCTSGMFWHSGLYALIQSIVTEFMWNKAFNTSSHRSVYDADLQLGVASAQGTDYEILPGKNMLQRLWGEVGRLVLYGIPRDMRWQSKRLRRVGQNCDLTLKAISLECGRYKAVDNSKT